MNVRVARIAGSLGSVLIAYWGYALTVVPLIEPPADPRRADLFSEASFAGAAAALANRTQELQGLFPSDAWELANPKILDNGQAKLLFREYRTLGDNRLAIDPCTVIFTPGGNLDASQTRPQAPIILEAPGGAVVQFDKPLELGRGQVGNLVGGKLNGAIRIRSNGKSPGPEDDLLLVTQNVELNEREIRTPHEVEFRWGPNRGRGSQLHIHLAAGEARSAKDGLNIGGLESVVLEHVDWLDLEPAKPRSNAPGPAGIRSRLDTSAPVRVTCRGPFRFDMPRRAATFHEQVDVLQMNPNGSSDRLACETLTVYFQPRRDMAAQFSAKEKGAAARSPGVLELEPQRIVAQGDPVIVHAPSKSLNAQGQNIEYDLWSGRIALEGSEEVWLKQGPNEIHAPGLAYLPSDRSALGQMEAKGPGWLRGQTAAQPDRQLEARWNERLLVRPQEQNQLISLLGGADLSFKEFGRLTAGQVHFWLSEVADPAQPGATRFQPDRMLAQSDVRIDATQLSGQVEHMEVWFVQDNTPSAEFDTIEHLRAPGSGPVAPPSAPRGPTGSLRTPADILGLAAAKPTGALLPRGRLVPTALALPNAAGQAAVASGPQSHYEILGRVLRVRLRLTQQNVQNVQQGTEVSELMVEDNVRFSETQTAQPGESPLVVTGDFLRAVEPTRPVGTVSVVGRPAHFEARGLGMTGGNINLNRGTNRLWIDGAGQMSVPMNRDLQGRAIQNPAVLDIRWHDSMNFDGRTATFQDSVSALAPQGNLQTETLEVQFQQPVHFSDASMRQQPQVEQIRCRGGVWMESSSIQGDEQTAKQTMEIADFQVNLLSGVFSGAGPGWITHIGRGNQVQLPGAGPQFPPASTGSGLNCLHVRFQGPTTGNVLRRQSTFQDHVEAVYGPVDSWQAKLDPNQPEALGPRGATLRCNQLTVQETPTPIAGQQTYELEATGNTVIESQSYTARALRVTYDQSKGMLKLEGDGRTDAELFRQQQVGSPPSRAAAQRIFYWPQTNQIKIDGARSLQLGQFPGGAPQ